MNDQSKITVNVPSHLLARAREVTGKGVSETVREALAQLVHVQGAASS